MTVKPKEIVPESTLVAQRKQGLSIIAPFKLKVTAMVIKTAEEYELGDEVLAQIRQAKKDWEGRLNPIIEPIKAGLDSLYSLRRDVLKPLEDLEGQVKERMRAFKLLEARQLREAEQKRNAELAKLQEEAIKKEQAALKQKTAPLREKLLQAQAEAQQKAAALEYKPLPEAVRAQHSTPRNLKKWVITDKKLFLQYVIQNPALLDLVVVDSVQMNAYFKLEKPEVGTWMQGVIVEEDIQIAGR